MNLSYAEVALLRQTSKIIGKNINKIRNHRNFTLKKVSRRSGLRIETLDRYELGKKIVPFPALMKIATALEVKIEKLMEST